MRTSRPLAAALAAALLLTAACGDDDATDAGDDTTTTTEALEDETSTTIVPDDEDDEPADDTTTTTAEDGEGIDPLEGLAQSLLITLDELAVEGFQDVGYTPTDGPNQCGVDLDAEHPNQVLVGTTLGHDQLAFQQEIRVYGSTQEAMVAFSAGVDGATCEGLPDGTTFTEPTDVTEAVGGDQAIAITATNPTTEAVVVAVLLSDSVVSFTFVSSPPGSAESLGAPNPAEVAAFGVGKIEAALESSGG